MNRLFTIIPYDELFYTLDILIKKDRELICFSNWIRGDNRNNKHTSLDDVFEDIFISKLDMSKSLKEISNIRHGIAEIIQRHEKNDIRFIPINHIFLGTKSNPFEETFLNLINLFEHYEEKLTEIFSINENFINTNNYVQEYTKFTSLSKECQVEYLTKYSSKYTRCHYLYFKKKMNGLGLDFKCALCNCNDCNCFEKNFYTL